MTVKELRAEIIKLRAEIRQVESEIEAGTQLTPRQMMRQLIIETFNETFDKSLNTPA